VVEHPTLDRGIAPDGAVQEKELRHISRRKPRRSREDREQMPRRSCWSEISMDSIVTWPPLFNRA